MSFFFYYTIPGRKEKVLRKFLAFLVSWCAEKITEAGNFRVDFYSGDFPLLMKKR